MADLGCLLKEVIMTPNRIEKVIVKDCDKDYEITVQQKSKTVWIARGMYMGEYLESKGASSSAAVAHWLKQARYKGGL